MQINNQQFASSWQKIKEALRSLHNIKHALFLISILYISYYL